MQSLFSESERASIIERINALTPASKPVWGKMNVAQMLAHCQVPLRIASGEVKLKRSLIGMLFGRFAKKQMLVDKPFKQNLPTDKHFVVANPRDFDSEKETLVHLVERFSRSGAAGLTGDAHPFFGKMQPEEWDKLQWKHLDHHLRQFNV